MADSSKNFSQQSGEDDEENGPLGQKKGLAKKGETPQEDRKEALYHVAREMLASGVDMKTISQSTGLSKKEIQKLARK